MVRLTGVIRNKEKRKKKKEERERVSAAEAGLLPDVFPPRTEDPLAPFRKRGGLTKKAAPKAKVTPSIVAPTVVPPTPEVTEERQRQSQIFISKREKRKAELLKQGLTDKQATAQALKDLRQVVEKQIEEKRVAEEPVRLLKTQQEILEREKIKREGEKLPPIELPPITEPALVQTEQGGILQKIEEAYKFVDTLGGLIPENPELLKGTVPIGPVAGAGILGSVKQGKAALNTAKVSTGLRSKKAWTGMLKFLKSKIARKIGKYGVIGGVLLTEKSMASIDSALSQVRESITIPVQLAAANPLRISDSFDQVTELEDDVSEYEAMVKVREPFSLTVKLTGRTLPIYQRIAKLRSAIDLARTQIAKIEAEGEVLSDEETALMLKEINIILDDMEQPSKFLGLF